MRYEPSETSSIDPITPQKIASALLSRGWTQSGAFWMAPFNLQVGGRYFTWVEALVVTSYPPEMFQ